MQRSRHGTRTTWCGRWLLLCWMIKWTSRHNAALGFTATRGRQRQPRRAFPRKMAAKQEESIITAPPYRGIASVDLYKAWLDLVRNNQVVATTTLVDDNKDETSRKAQVRYGVRLIATGESTNENACQEFVQQVRSEADQEEESSASTTTPHPRIQAIQAALEVMQQQSKDGGAGGVKYAMDTAGFVAQLQLIRTLRPPAAFSFASSEKTSCIPPPYVYEKDSFVVGPLRLPLRPRVAQLNVLSPGFLHTPWDVYHNVSPADPRGHFLLLPALQSEDATPTGDNILRSNCRAQVLTKEDCHDVVQLVATNEPLGSLLVCYNSIGAGASQNHIHLHAWPSPPLPLQQEYPDRTGWDAYPVSQTMGLYDFLDLCDGTIEVTFLEYPCCCFLLSAYRSVEVTTGGKDDPLTILGNVLYKVLESISDAPHNVCLLNRPVHADVDADDGVLEGIQMDGIGNQRSPQVDSGVAVDIYVFVRSRERSTSVAPSLKIGASEMMGVFHSQSENEVQELCPVPRDASHQHDDSHELTHDHNHENAQETKMQTALEEVSYEPRLDLWENLKEILAREFW
eukprot:scaffold926_cov163-Amphora_coffeaeformis.AAC.2